MKGIFFDKKKFNLSLFLENNELKKLKERDLECLITKYFSEETPEKTDDGVILKFSRFYNGSYVSLRSYTDNYNNIYEITINKDCYKTLKRDTFVERTCKNGCKISLST